MSRPALSDGNIMQVTRVNFTFSTGYILKSKKEQFKIILIIYLISLFQHVKSISEIFYILFCTKSSKPIVCLSSQHASLWTSYISSSVSTATCDPWLPAGQRRSRAAPVFSQDPLTLAKKKRKKKLKPNYLQRELDSTQVA